MSSCRSSSASRSASTRWRCRDSRRAHGGPGVVEDGLQLGAGLRVAEHRGDQVVRRGGERDERAGHPGRADHLRGGPRRRREVPGRSGAGLPEEQLLGHPAAHRDLHEGAQVVVRVGPDLLAVAVREQPERVAAADDREHLEGPVRCREPRGDGVAGLVGGDEPLLAVGVADGVADADHLGDPGVLDVRVRHGHRAAAQGVDQRLVQQVLDHHRRPPVGRRGQAVAQGRVVELGVGGAPGQEVVDERASAHRVRASRTSAAGRSGRAAAAPGRGSRRGWWRRSAGSAP